MAQANNWSLEELYLDVSGGTANCNCMVLVCSCNLPIIPASMCVLQVHVDSKGQLNDCSFGVTGMFVCYL